MMDGRAIALVALLVTASWNGAAAQLELRLLGVVVGGAGGGAAYLEDPTTGKVRAYRVGETIGDSRLVRIDVDRVVLQRGDDTVELLLLGGAVPICPPTCPTAPRPTDLPQPCPPNCPSGQTLKPGSADPSQPCPPNCSDLQRGVPGPAPGPGFGSPPCPPFCPPGQGVPVSPGPGAGGPPPCPPVCPSPRP